MTGHKCVLILLATTYNHTSPTLISATVPLEMELNYLETIQTWRAAQKQLDEAIHQYLQSIITLSSIPSNSVEALSVAGSGVDGIWDEIHDVVQTTPSSIQSLKKGMNTLCLIRNRSPSLVPINRLPSEILIHIFRLCVCKPKTEWGDRFPCGSYHHSIPKLVDLSRVCAQWRAVVVHEPSFWSHLAFCPDRYSETSLSWNLLQIAIERSSGHNLCLTVPSHRSSHIATHPEETRVAFKRLRPFSGNVKHLSVLACEQYRTFVPWFLENIEAHNIQSFTLSANDKVFLAFGSNVTATDESYPALSEPKFELYLRPIRSLHLQQASFDWDNPAYRNLVSLTLDSVSAGRRTHPTVDNILSILSASLQLHTLCLRTTIFPSNNESALPTRVHLGALINLDLRRVGAAGLIQLLPRLSTSSKRLSVSFEAGERLANFYKIAMKEFLARVNITRLLLECTRPPIYGFFDFLPKTESMQDICSMVPDLESLALIGGSNSNLLDVMMRPSSANEYEPLCPRLRTLYAIDWRLNQGDIENISKAYPALKKMRLVGCNLPARPEFDEWLAHEVKCAKVMDTKWEPYRSSRDYLDPTWE